MSERVAWVERVSFPALLRKNAVEYLKEISLKRGRDFMLVPKPLTRTKIDVMRFSSAAHAALFLLWLPSR